MHVSKKWVTVWYNGQFEIIEPGKKFWQTVIETFDSCDSAVKWCERKTQTAVASNLQGDKTHLIKNYI